MLLIVDYDNVNEGDRRYGIEHVLRKALSLCDSKLNAGDRVTARLYGGWCEGGKYTRAAQDHLAEIAPMAAITHQLSGSRGAVFVAPKLALSTISDPAIVITNTFRQKGFPRGVRCHSRPWLACRDAANCSLAGLEQLLSDDVCGNGCAVRPPEVFWRAEQKLVDTMMVADLIAYSQTSNLDAAVLSRDDDIWPGLSLASKTLRTLFHISTVESTRLPKYFSSLPTPPYIFAHWR